MLLLMFGWGFELLDWLLTSYYWGDCEDLLRLGLGRGTVTADVSHAIQVKPFTTRTYPR